MGSGENKRAGFIKKMPYADAHFLIFLNIFRVLKHQKYDILKTEGKKEIYSKFFFAAVPEEA